MELGIIIEFSQDSMSNLTGYYRNINVQTENMYGWYNTNNLTYSTTLSETMIYEAYSYSNTSGEGEHIRKKINIMPNPDSLQSNYYSYGSGKIYPVTVTGKTGSGYGTDIYSANSNYFTPIGVAAVHSGLLQIGETKTLYIKIVPCPEGGYVGSRRNGVTTSTLNSTHKGYVFVK